MHIALLSLLAMTAVVHAQAPGATDPTPAPADAGTPDHGSSLTYTFGADGHLGFGSLVESNVAGRFELGVAPGHSLFLRAGIGTQSWFETEFDDPIWHERFARVGYRMSARRVYLAFEVGDSWFKAEYLPEEQMHHDPEWFDRITATTAVGVKLGPVRLSLDYTYPFQQVGVQLGFDVLSL